MTLELWPVPVEASVKGTDAPTDPLGTADASTGTASNLAAIPPFTHASNIVDHVDASGDGAVLIYCNGEPVECHRFGNSFVICRCGFVMRVVW
jgi:hypothetical protein